jgi:Holliday junction resolvase RusA-like endonuclease
MSDDELLATLTEALGDGVDRTVVFAQPARRLSMNDRGHWRTRHRLTRAWRHAAFYAACDQLGVSPSARRQPPCFVLVTFPVPDPGRRRDADNPAPTCKAIVDGMVDAGVWVDDTPDQVWTLPSRFASPSTGPVVVQLLPRANGAR